MLFTSLRIVVVGKRKGDKEKCMSVVVVKNMKIHVIGLNVNVDILWVDFGDIKNHWNLYGYICLELFQALFLYL